MYQQNCTLSEDNVLLIIIIEEIPLLFVKFSVPTVFFKICVRLRTWTAGKQRNANDDATP